MVELLWWNKVLLIRGNTEDHLPEVDFIWESLFPRTSGQYNQSSEYNERKSPVYSLSLITLIRHITSRQGTSVRSATATSATSVRFCLFWPGFLFPVV